MALYVFVVTDEKLKYADIVFTSTGENDNSATMGITIASTEVSIILVLISLTGCYSAQGLETLAYAVAIGIDKGDKPQRTADCFTACKDLHLKILNDVNSELGKYDEFPKELNPTQKMMGWFDIQISTLNDNSDSKIAEMLIKGTNMGIIEGVKLLNNNPETTNNIKNILNNFIHFQENNVERLKKYL